MATFYEAFTGQDWDSASVRFGKGACGSCIVIGVVSLFLRYNVWISLWTLVVGLVLAIWELPLIYSLFRQCEEARVILTDTVHLKLPLVKAAVYLVLSILCYTQQTLCIIAGIILNISSTLYISAAINRHDDAASGLTTDDEASTVLSNKFGTF